MMTNDEIFEEMERVCRKIGHTKDPHKMWELEIELENLHEQMERGGK